MQVALKILQFDLYAANVGADGWNVAKQEDGGYRQGKPNDVAINLLHRYQHHRVEEVVSYIFPEVEMSQVEAGERELAAIVLHVIIQEMREDGGVNTITRRSCQIHVEDVEHEQAHEE